MTNIREQYSKDIQRVLGDNPDELDIPTFIRNEESRINETDENKVEN